jgi:hypothetical protein
MPARPTPFDLLFGALAPERFPRLRGALEASGCPPEDREGFLLVREVAELLRELRPETGMGEAVHALVALLHCAYLYWLAGQPVQQVGEEQLAHLVERSWPAAENLPASAHPDVPTRYVQLPPLRVWATPVAGQPDEPLDGWFAWRSGQQLRLLAVFGLSPTREGLTVVELSGPRPALVRRLDGTPPFSPLLAGGAAAGLLSLAGEEELLALAWRAEAGR